ncbi:hypothetical protein APX01_16835 [Cereibacter sphaeroides]|jgi:hypothetical protein|nr:hypothetical protein [Cereibacter sphaeroides]ABN79115.1 hypothetical protein Rsph17029_4037 [Cereibacter sphaeroides ATCC 17029]AMJ49233.1 hypothetical protein APX01_16835 [Cereibacter sphaeroides]ANS35939.1 hypothetical protein A3858_16835 [Cereibacter sphaeroides]ATN65003.1 hypothetical protein A3857_16850 [Cereibacter sphaeroides]QJC86174.1 hypothetical protein HGN32_18445 [Cereibacter sphaeroides]
MRNDASAPARDHADQDRMMTGFRNVSNGSRPGVMGKTVAQVRPLASYRFENWQPGPSFWEPKVDVPEDQLTPERVLLSLMGSVFVAASVLIAILLVFS